MKWAWAALCALLVAGGCKDEAKAPAAREEKAAAAESGPDTRPEIGVVTQVIAKVVDPGAAAGPSGADLGKALGQQLAASELFALEGEPVPADRRPRRVEVEAIVTSDVVEGARHGGASLVVTVSARLRWLDGASGLDVTDNVLVERPLERGDRARLEALVAEEVAAAVAAAGRGLLAKEALRRGSDADVVAALSAGDPHRVAWALALAGDRRLGAAVPAAIDHLDADDALVRDAAFAALVAIGDPRAVEALTRQVDFQDYDGVRAVIEAVSAIGGAEAAAFLEFVASGHPDESIRARAAAALGAL